MTSLCNFLMLSFCKLKCSSTFTKGGWLRPSKIFYFKLFIITVIIVRVKPCKRFNWRKIASIFCVVRRLIMRLMTLLQFFLPQIFTKNYSDTLGLIVKIKCRQGVCFHRYLERVSFCFGVLQKPVLQKNYF